MAFFPANTIMKTLDHPSHGKQYIGQIGQRVRIKEHCTTIMHILIKRLALVGHST
jgi:hypothetical protein